MVMPKAGPELNGQELVLQPLPSGRFRPIRCRSQAPTPTRPFKGITAPQRGAFCSGYAVGMPKNSRLGAQYVSEEASMLAARLVRRLKKQGWSLSVAESCTGGLLASCFTDISGASSWFTQGWVTYSNESKISQLGVNPKKLEKRGAVSHEVALGMAQGAKKSSESGVSISITGVAGPTGGERQRYCHVSGRRGSSPLRYLQRCRQWGPRLLRNHKNDCRKVKGNGMTTQDR